MKISYYELINMMKNKVAPKKIKYDDYEFYGDSYNYQWCDDNGDLHFLSDYMSMDEMSKHEIEILEEEKKIPEKLDISNFPRHNNSLKKTAIKLNEIIDYLKSKGDE